MTALRVLGPLDPNFGWDGIGLLDGSGPAPPRAVPRELRGAHASVEATGNIVRLLRDPLGLNKLFWGTADDGALLVAARPHRLVEVGCSMAEIRAVPPGAVIDLDLATNDVHVAQLRAPGRPAGAGDGVEGLAGRIRATLQGYCAALAVAFPGRPALVCLSGGLDSAGVALVVRQHFPGVTAVSFDIERDHHPPSADRQTAERLAADLGLPLLAVTVAEDALLDGLDAVLRDGIDWRDFNVHAALVNAALARGIAQHVAGRAGTLAPLVFTGDLANEYVCDYHPERYRGQTYYPLPRLPAPALQGALVRGLESCHREVGPFQAWDLAAVQLYAPAVDHYLELPDDVLADPAGKSRLGRLIFGPDLPDYIYARPKTRAQIGDADGARGVLAVCVDQGIDQAWLRRRFAELHEVSDCTVLDRFLRGGRYRAAVPTV